MAEERDGSSGDPQVDPELDDSELGSDEGAADDESLDGETMPPMDFSIFVLSLNTSALVHLGHAPGGGEVNLPLARQVIDIIAMLEQKTRGNLTGKEEQLIHQVLFDLRMRYARQARPSTDRV